MKNSVFHSNVNTKAWLIAALIRSLKTVAQTIIAMIPVAVAVNTVDWQTVLATAATAGILSIATSIVGIPEVPAISESDSRVTIPCDVKTAGDETAKQTGDSKTE